MLININQYRKDLLVDTLLMFQILIECIGQSCLWFHANHQLLKINIFLILFESSNREQPWFSGLSIELVTWSWVTI